MARCCPVSLQGCGGPREVCAGYDLASVREKDHASGLREVVERDLALVRSCDRLWLPQWRRRHARGRCRTSVKQILVSPLCVLILICEFHSIYLVVHVCECRYLVELLVNSYNCISPGVVLSSLGEGWKHFRTSPRSY